MDAKTLNGLKEIYACLEDTNYGTAKTRLQDLIKEGMHRHSYGIAADILILKDNNEILLIQRRNDPFKGMWAIPGGFVEPDESIEAAALRELKEETCLTGIELKQFRINSAPDRDPRGRTISVSFYGKIKYSDLVTIKAEDDAVDFAWFSLRDIVSGKHDIAFDHRNIIAELYVGVL